MTKAADVTREKSSLDDAPEPPQVGRPRKHEQEAAAREVRGKPGERSLDVLLVDARLRTRQSHGRTRSGTLGCSRAALGCSQLLSSIGYLSGDLGCAGVTSRLVKPHARLYK